MRGRGNPRAAPQRKAPKLGRGRCGQCGERVIYVAKGAMVNPLPKDGTRRVLWQAHSCQ